MNKSFSSLHILQVTLINIKNLKLIIRRNIHYMNFAFQNYVNSLQKLIKK